MNKKQLLIEFSRTPGAGRCKDVAHLEEKFSAWIRRNNIALRSQNGKDYRETEFYSSVNYTVRLLSQDRNLLYAFGLNESHLVHYKPEYRDNIKDGYSLLGQFKHYGNQVHNRRQDPNIRKNGLAGFFKSSTGVVILAIVAIAVLYKLVGPTVWGFITSGAMFKLICFALGALASFGILRSKKMGWPLPIKLIVLAVIWVVLLNYDF